MLTVSKVETETLGVGGIKLPPGTKLVTVCKGAPNFILDACSEFLDADGKFKDMTDAKKEEVLGVVDDFSSQALRVLAMAIVPMDQMPFDENDDEMQTDQKFAKCRQGLKLVGLGAAIDPERDGVPQAVVDAREAGIRVVMITGDYVKTATAIAKNCNILQKGDDEARDAVDCGALRPGGNYLPNGDIDEMTSRVKVFARAQPEDKLKIVESLQRQEYVSAMTGDGVNDAPALNRAEIGVAMGIQGTEVAKGASDMILRDDNFATIVTAVEKGRTIYAGIQKFVAFIMSVHIAEVLQIFICVVTSLPLMRTPLQILFLILVTDLPPSIALGMEVGERGIMKRKPRPKKEPVALKWMTMNYTMNGLILAAVITGVYVYSLAHYVGVFTGGQRNNLIRELGLTCGKMYEQCYDTECNDRVNHFEKFDFLQASFQSEGRPAVTGDAVSGWSINEKLLPSYRLMDPASVCDPHDDWTSTSCESEFGSTNWEDAEWRQKCAEHKGAGWVAAMMMNARTVAFISLVFSENVRAYISRSFTNHVWVRPFDNKNMQYAIGLAEMCLMVAVFVPFLNTKILGLDGMKIGIGWVIALAGPLGCLLLCEMYKVVTKHQIQLYEEKLEREQRAKAEQQQLEAIQHQNADLKKIVLENRVHMTALEREISAGQQKNKDRIEQLERQVSGQGDAQCQV